MHDSGHNLKEKRVILGLSGGVDSAVAAILLQSEGADVHALHMTNWEDEDGYCTAADDLQDARVICEQLGITLHHVNFAREYRAQVFDNFLDEYRAGRTPNPDGAPIGRGLPGRQTSAELFTPGHDANSAKCRSGIGKRQPGLRPFLPRLC